MGPWILAWLAGCDDDGEPTGYRYRDLDRDGFGSEALREGGAPVPGWVARRGDCDDHDPAVHPGSDEHCNGLDEDCDGVADDGVDAQWVGVDEDGDGHAHPTIGVFACGLALPADDCDDADPAVPSSLEACDGRDDDCDGFSDDSDPEGATGVAVWWWDADDDGHGDPAVRRAACEGAPGWVNRPDDCDDANPTVHPGGLEVCGGGDEDCDGAVDGADPDLVAGPDPVAWLDRDGDGLGDPAAPSACATAGAVPDASDCDDARVDVGADAVWLHDSDGDGVGMGPPVTGTGCAATSEDVAPLSAGADCDDADPLVHPGASDLCGDGVDLDCDGVDGPCGAATGGQRAVTEAGAEIVGSFPDFVLPVASVGDLDLDGAADLALGAVLVRGPVTGAHVTAEFPRVSRPCWGWVGACRSCTTGARPLSGNGSTPCAGEATHTGARRTSRLTRSPTSSRSSRRSDPTAAAR